MQFNILNKKRAEVRKYTKRSLQSPYKWLPLLFGLLYLLLPTGNSSLDAVYYATNVKYAEALLHPHHLLYNVVIYALYRLPLLVGLSPDVLAFAKGVNAVSAALCLWLLGLIIRRLKFSANVAATYILLVGSSFAVMRFATENETYILPIVFSLSASYFFVCAIEKPRTLHLLQAGVLAAAACLLHQIHVFWWIGLGIGFLARVRYRAIYYALPALIVPALYVWAAARETGNTAGLLQTIDFALTSFDADSGISYLTDNFIFTGISTVRTFAQVHGQMYQMLQNTLWWAVPAGISVILLTTGLFRPNVKRSETDDKITGKVHILIFVLQFIFAFYSDGNAEFMVMLPFLVAIVLPHFWRFGQRFLLSTGMAMLCWNLAYGLIPAHAFDLFGFGARAQIIEKYPDAIYITADALQLNYELYYHCGTEQHLRVQLPQTQDKIAQYLRSGKTVLTDYPNHPQLLNRAAMAENKNANEIFSSFCLIPSDTIVSFAGVYTIYFVRTLDENVPHQKRQQMFRAQ